jgi:hypothetical protein
MKKPLDSAAKSEPVAWGQVNVARGLGADGAGRARAGFSDDADDSGFQVYV